MFADHAAVLHPSTSSANKRQSLGAGDDTRLKGQIAWLLTETAAGKGRTLHICEVAQIGGERGLALAWESHPGGVALPQPHDG